MPDFKNELQLVPKKPGCYQMKNANGEIIYVGKAKILQNRLRSYFTGSHDAKTTRMVQEVDHFEYIITSSELEAFLLELNFIKEHRPKYNIMLMDDKTYPYICITNEKHPRIIITRDLNSPLAKKGKLFGPYPNVKACRDTLEILNKVYPFRKCLTIPKKACLYYFMGQCLAPCINKVTVQEYDELKQEVAQFLSGNNLELLHSLEDKMAKASEELDFEKAIEYRDLIKSIEAMHDEQKMTLKDGINRDIFGYYIKDDIIAIQVFHMRAGKIIERSGEVFDLNDTVDEVLISYIAQFYRLKANVLPQEILIPYLNGYELLNRLLDIKILVPVKGTKKRLVELVCENAQINLENLQKRRLQNLSKTTEAIEAVGKLLEIPYPKVVELFDNSNIQGAHAVSAMVTYVDGVPSTKDYRKYKIKTVEGADDYHTMQEVTRRRYSKVLKENLRVPNLILVDGGKPQIRAVQEVLAELGLSIEVAGLVKDDKHRTRALMNKNYQEIEIDKHSNVFLLLEAMQNEVHRFAITFFKKVHSENSLSSRLDGIEGIGPSRKKMLLRHFDSLEAIQEASIDKLKALGLPEKIAIALLEALNRPNSVNGSDTP